MRTNKMLQKIRAGKVARICSLGFYHPAYFCQAANSNYDAVWLCLEHNAMNPREVEAMIAFSHLYDIDCLLRPSMTEKNALYRFLEDGAAGFMIPHVSTKQRAEELVQATKFPPLGDRGQDGAGLDNDFYIHGTETYPTDANAETFLIVLIETLEAVENAEAIASVEGVGGLFIGPGDLGLRIKNSNTSVTLESARKQVAAACAKHGKAWGVPAANEAEIAQYTQEGALFIACGGAFMAVKDMLEETGQQFDRACGK